MLCNSGLGPDARAVLRPVPRQGRVHAAGVDTWSPCWYAEPGSPLARAMEALASEQTRRARLLPEPLAGHRVGWFPGPRLVFAEGRAGGERLLAADELPEALDRLDRALADLGIPLAAALGERVGEAVRAGQLLPSRARSLGVDISTGPTIDA